MAESLPMATTMYGIKNCDTIKKARRWLDDHGVDYAFHDYKSSGVDRPLLTAWCEAHGWETICNRAGTTFRQLPDADKTGLSQAKAITLMLASPSIIKRPILVVNDRSIVGFSPETYAALFPAGAAAKR